MRKWPRCWRRSASDARTRIANVRDGLRSILRLLSDAPGTVVRRGRLSADTADAGQGGARRSLEARPKARVIAKQAPKRGNGKASAVAKRKRASA